MKLNGCVVKCRSNVESDSGKSLCTSDDSKEHRDMESIPLFLKKTDPN